MTLSELQERLAEPFDIRELKHRPQSAKGNRCMALTYIDCRVVMDRLDDVVGVGNWQDEYNVLADGSVICQLRVCLDGNWITKTDVGSPSEQPDAGDRLKAAFSDALKRAAVKFGIGRYLYRLKNSWVDYDPQSKTMSAPVLPQWAIPKPKKPAPQASDKPPVPKTGKELYSRLVRYENDLIAKGTAHFQQVTGFFATRAQSKGFPPDVEQWTEAQVTQALSWWPDFEKTLGK